LSPLRTVVIGGGIGGLSVAREFTIRGLPIVVLERASKSAPVGAGIIMNPNAMRVLERNGLAESLRALGWPYLARDTHDRHGRLLATRDYRPLYESGRLAVGTLVHRAHLHRVLHESLPPGTVRFGALVRELKPATEGITVVTDTGETFEADLVIGADGIRSMVRERWFGGGEPLYLGYRSHRFVVENRDRVAYFTEFLGRGKRIGLVPIASDQIYVWTTFDSASESTAWALESPAAFRALFAEFTDARVRGVFAQVTDMAGVLCTDIEEVHAPEWVRGRVVLLGDAAHALTPNMGQGAGMAMEDAAVLADELAQGDRCLEEALASWERRRRPRVVTITRLSREIGEDGQRRGALACWLRDRRIRREGRDVEGMQSGLERLLGAPL
jgi:2-polyprenyl-6-methoxyphenol hydroxylase-like FAD-dependent oxidoreductase